MSALLVLLVVVPAVAGAALCLVGPAADRVAAAVSVTVAGAAVAVSLVVAVTRPAAGWRFLAGAPFGLRVDGLASLVAPTVTTVTLLVLVFAAEDVRQACARFHGLMLLFAAAAALTVVATTLPTLLVAWEVMGATSYALIGFTWQDQRKVSSGLTAFLTTRSADLGLYVASGAALAGGAGLRLDDLADTAGGWRHVVAAGIAVAALSKAAQLPFSFWIRRAMDGPSPVSALLHSAAMVALGGFLLLRVSPLLAATGWADDLVAWVGAATAVLLGAVAVVQTDLKQLLAASTSAQLGFVVLAAGVGATAGGAAHLVAHAAVKSLLFLTAGAWLTALGTKQLAALTGAARRWRWVGVAAGAGFLSLAGLAPLALWATKDAVLTGAREHSAALYVAGLVGSVLSGLYAGRALAVLWAPSPSEVGEQYDDEESGTRRVGPLARAALAPLVLGAVGLGALALPPLGEHVRVLLGADEGSEATPTELVVSAVLAVLAVGVAVAVTLRRRTGRHSDPVGAAWAQPLRGWGGLEEGAHRLVVVPTLWLSAVAAAADDRVLHRSVRAVGTAARALATASATADRRDVDGAVRAVAAGTRELGGWARRPQTGQLHQYYLQAVVVVAVAVLVLVSVR